MHDRTAPKHHGLRPGDCCHGGLLVLPCNATRDNCHNRPYNQQRECRPDALPHDFSTALESHQVQEKIYKVARLPGFQSGRAIMLSTALYQLVVSLSRLCNSTFFWESVHNSGHRTVLRGGRLLRLHTNLPRCKARRGHQRHGHKRTGRGGRAGGGGYRRALHLA